MSRLSDECRPRWVSRQLDRIRNKVGGALWWFVERRTKGAITRRLFRYHDANHGTGASRCTGSATSEANPSEVVG